MTTIDQASIDQFKIHLAQRGRQPATVDSYGRDCVLFLDFMDKAGVPAGDVAPDVFRQFQEHLNEKGIRGNSVRRTVIGVRQFFRYLQDRYQWDRSPLDEAPIPERIDSFVNRVTSEIMTSLMGHAKSSLPEIKAHRDVAMILLLGFEGLKVHELIQLEWRDFVYTHSQGMLAIRGDRARSITLDQETSASLRQLRQSTDALRADLTTPIAKIMLGFKGTAAGYVMPSLTRHGVKFALYELGNSVKILQLNSEELRHHAMAHKVANGFSPEMLMNHLGLRTIGKAGAHFLTSSPS